MKANANNVLKVLILGVAILVTGGEVFAASGTGGFGGKGTTVNCQCIGGWGMTGGQIGSTRGFTLGHETSNSGVGETSPWQGGAGGALGGNHGGQSQLGSIGTVGNQGGNPDGCGTITYLNG
jgi:hypothetical protein